MTSACCPAAAADSAASAATSKGRGPALMSFMQSSYRRAVPRGDGRWPGGRPPAPQEADNYGAIAGKLVQEPLVVPKFAVFELQVQPAYQVSEASFTAPM